MNKKVIISIIVISAVIAGGVYLAFNANDKEDVMPPDDTSVVKTNDTIFINNQGGSMEGHTPRGFRGSGTGLFAGDNLNPGFPDGDGVQLFLTFDLNSLFDNDFRSVVLSSQSAHVQGTPFGDLGALTVEAVEYSKFSPALWELEPIDSVCILSVTGTGPFACDVTSAIRQALGDGRPTAQFRIRFERAGDNDGSADLVMFYNTNSNTNEPGLFKLTVNPDSPLSAAVTKCLPKQRNVGACIEIYQPVCGKVNVECITTPCDPVEKTFSNSCFACTNSFVESYTEGKCLSE